MANETPAVETTTTPAATIETPVTPAVTTPPVVTPPAAAATTPAVVPAATTEVKPPVETPVAAKVVPEAYDIKLPEGSGLDAKVVEDAKAYAKSLGLTNEQAQELLNKQDGTVKSFALAQKAEYDAKVESWKTQVLADKEIGGDNLPVSVEMAKRALTKFGGETLTKMLDDTGFGNHPEVIRAFARIGKAMAEDKIVSSGLQPGGKKDMSAKFYPNQK